MPALIVSCGELASGIGIPNLGPSAAELALAKMSSRFGGALVEWWSGNAGLTINGLSSKWQGRLRGYFLRPSYTAAPVAIGSAINGRGAIGLLTNCGMEDQDGRNLMPASGDWTVAVIYKQTSVGAQNRGIICDGNAAAAAASFVMHRNDGKFEYRRNNVQLSITTATLAPNVASTLIMSWKHSATRFTMRKDGAQVLQGTSAQAQESSVFGIGSISTTTGFGSVATNIAPDLIAEVLVFNKDLMDVDNAGILAAVESNIRTIGATW